MTDVPKRSFLHRWLLVIPFLWQVGMVPFVNDVAWRPFSLPFPMAWQMAGIVVTSIVIGIVFLIDKRQERGLEDAPPPSQPGDGH